MVPTFYAVTWVKQPKFAMILAPLCGISSGVIAWLVTAATLNDGVLTIETTGTLYAQLAGNLAAICMGGIVASVISLVMPDNYDFDQTRAINQPLHHNTVQKPAATEKQQPESDANSVSEGEKKASTTASPDIAQGEMFDEDAGPEEEPEDPAALARAVKIAVIAGTSLSAILVLILPLPLFFSHYVFSKGFFTFWIILGILWAFVGTFITVLLPIWESWGPLRMVCRGIKDDLTGKRIAGRAE